MRQLEMHMWAEACEMLRRAERLHGQFFRPKRSGMRYPVWEPPVDVFETDREYLINVALPGVEPTEIRVEIEPGAIVVSCDRSAAVGSDIRAVHRMEIPHGRFERRIGLPSDSCELDQYEVLNGCLALRLRKG